MRTLVVVTLLCLVCGCSKEDATGWKKWNVYDTPVFTGQYPLVGDPSVLHEPDQYRMYYTGFDPVRTPQGPEICQATSPDGIHWTNVPVAGAVEGRMLYTGSNSWSNAHETCFIRKQSATEFLLYYIGYEDKGTGFFGADSVSLGVATSSDGVTFEATPPAPILRTSANGYDRNAMSSPAIITYHDSLVMIYAGYCYTACGPTVTTNLLAARSVDGIHWEKRTTPVIDKTQIPWASKGVAEAEIIIGPDELYYLFMSSVDEPHVIGVARGATPYGPWEINPVPVINADKAFSTKGAVAPSVLYEEGKLKMWYHGSTGTALAIGYAEVTWPVR